MRSGTRVDVTIPETAISDGEGELDYWLNCRRLWRAAGGEDYSLWGKYRRLVESGRYHFADRQGSGPYGFAEAFTTLALERRGFKCWTGVHLFGRRPVRAEVRKRNTDAVELQLKRDGFELPANVSRDAKNPDIVAYHPRLKEWRFCEVKRTEEVARGQIIGLAILHLVTGGPVTVVRLVGTKNVNPKLHHARFCLRTSIRTDDNGAFRLAPS
jgi:hypothetical protein